MIPISNNCIDPPAIIQEPNWIELTKEQYDKLFDLKFETVKFIGEDFERETFESLCQRKSSDIEFSMNGFIEIKENK